MNRSSLSIMVDDVDKIEDYHFKIIENAIIVKILFKRIVLNNKKGFRELFFEKIEL